MGWGEEHTATKDLAERARAIADEAVKPPSFEQVRRALNDVGINAARRTLLEAPDLIADARSALREAQVSQEQAKAAYDTAVTEEEWALSGSFEARSNKQWLTMRADGTPIPEAEQKSYDAAERKAWTSHHAALQPEVRKAIARLSEADREVARCRDDLAVAEARMTAAKHNVDAAAAELRFLALSIPAN